MKTEKRNCIKCNHDFVLEQDDFSFYEKMKVPAPHVCPDCRFKMQCLFRNETVLYSGQKCDLCSKNIVTTYNPKSPYTVYCHECFYSDKWESKSYAKDYDFSKSFLEQFSELLISVPKISTYLSSGIGPNFNSEYTNMAAGCKDCYFVFNTGPAEEVLYARGVKDGRDSMDFYFGTSFDRCYEGVNIQKSSGIIYGQNVVGSVDCYFVYNVSGLTNCFGCVNLRNKSYCWFNEQLSHEEYNNQLNEIRGSFVLMEEQKEKFKKFCSQFPKRENNNLKSVESSGDYIYESKNVKKSFEASKAEDCKYLFSSKDIKDSLGVTGYGHKCERILESAAIGFSSNIIGSYGMENSSNVLYGFYSTNCTDVIACDAVKNLKYAVFNKEYSKEDYEKIREHIVNELTDLDLYGLMMPPEIAPFAYNETVGMDNMPMSKEEVLAAGFRWEDEIQMTKGRETIALSDIPDNIKDVSDSIINEILCCSKCERNYKITEAELLFYKKMVLPIPHQCFYCRHHDRVLRRGPYKFWHRNCAHCSKEIETNYAPDRPEIVYCEKCYQQEVL